MNDYDSADDYNDHDDDHNDEHDDDDNDDNAGHSRDCHGKKTKQTKHCVGNVRKRRLSMPQYIRTCNVTHRVALEYVCPPRKE